MKFLDSNIFIYAFYRPRRRLSQREKQMKDISKKVVTEIEIGREAVVTTVVHLSEVVNILKHGLRAKELGELVEGLLMLDSVDVVAVSKQDYLAATELGQELGLDSNDALAFQVMQSKGLKEVLSFDKVFENLEGINRVPVIH